MTVGATDDRPQRFHRGRPDIVVWLLVGAGLGIGLWRARHMYPIYDDWMILGSRRDLLGDDSLAAYFLRPHNEHLMAGAVLVHHVVLAWFGLESYLPWTIVLFAGDILVVVVLRAVMVRVGVRRTIASAVAPVLLIWSTIDVSLVWWLEGVFGVVTALVLIQFLLVVDDRPCVDRRDVLGAALATVAIALHSSAVVGVAVLVVMLLMQRSLRRAAVAAIPGALFALWLVTYGRSGRVWQSSPGDVDWTTPIPFTTRLSRLPRFVVDLWSRPLEPLLPSALAVVVLVVLCIAGCLMTTGAARRLMALVLATAVLFTLIVGVGRTDHLAYRSLAQAPRYVFVIMLLTAPAVVSACQSLVDNWLLTRSHTWSRAMRSVALAGIVVGLAAANALHERRHPESMDMLQASATMHRDVLTSVGAEPRLASVPGSVRLLSTLVDFDLDHARRLIAAGKLPISTTTDDGTEAYLQRRLFVRAEPRQPGDQDAVLPRNHPAIVDLGDGCAAIAPTKGRSVEIARAGSGPAAMSIVEGVGAVSLRTARPGSPTTQIPDPSFPVPGEVRIDVDPGVRLLLDTAETITVCGVVLG